MNQLRTIRTRSFWWGVAALSFSVMWWVFFAFAVVEYDLETVQLALPAACSLTGLGIWCVRRGIKRVAEIKILYQERVLASRDVSRVASYKGAGVEFTDTSIRTKRFFRWLEVPYYSIKGCRFRIRVPHFDCMVRYVDRTGREKEAKVASSKDATVQEIYTHILQVCDSLGHRIMQYPDPKMVRWGYQLQSFSVACEFVEPSVDGFKLSSGGGYPSWRRDLGGYMLQSPSINMAKVLEIGTASYHYGAYGGGWVTTINYDFDYAVKVTSVPRVACTGSPMKKFGGRMVGYKWEGATFAQILNDDAQLREMLVKAKAPAIKLKENHIVVRHNRFPSERLFRCVERIADHVRQEAGW